jgi:hypothetical protein
MDGKEIKSMKEEVNYIFICCSGHSGSTLLDLLLGSNSKISSLGEIIQLPKNISLNTLCTCGHPVRSCQLWKKVVSDLNRKLGIDIMKNPYSLNLGFPNPFDIKDQVHKSRVYHAKRKILKGIRYLELRHDLRFLRAFIRPIFNGLENTFSLYDSVRRIVPCDIIVDSSKSYLEAVGIYLSRPEKVRVLLLTRDGRGVFYSYLKRNFPKEALFNWKNHYQRGLPLLQKHVSAEHLIKVKYEDLVIDPRAELKRICKSVQVDYESNMLNFTSHVHHITNGNNMRFNPSSEIKNDDAWRHHLSQSDRAFFDSTAGDLNRILGYE